MQIYPAIDIKDGRCVRLSQGEFDSEKVYSEDPATVAKTFEEAGATWLHVVDLDGARDGRRMNEDTIKKITSTVHIPVELGGGIREMDEVARCLDMGVSRCVIGTRAVNDPAFVKALIGRFGPECVAVGVDAKDGKVAVEGWEKVSEVSAEELCETMKKNGVVHIIYTDIERDGMLTGPNVEAVKELADKTELPVIASGGVSKMDDLKELYDAGISGVIIGKALYENRIDLSEAINRFQGLARELPYSWKDFSLNEAGLIPVIVQDYVNGDVLMLAYMNEQAYKDTIQTGLMHYYSRSRRAQWFKGETSGHYQELKSLKLDCDNDTLLAKVDQTGAACHTGTRSCFFKTIC